ncbi:class I SAM-dependent methyltransferase [Mesorhizobium sp. CO1-1-9]|uniref:class I SAM-dependent methyltransferase n=1 Tax=Mesorhizobium sp. CO1-1-9 TaxID=2876630 RepID=UPI001CCA8C42|nr:class I SAM-dependent methyltransferase [Mesorhizobium sp. CO1-1-9]MBZ9694841.1 methyltransferase domain-containing protein [Mesorhizobium sp. CO1-1-9]
MRKNFDDLYKAFEDRFRGSREHVKERLQIYQPLLAQVPRQAEGPPLAIDLGCGRGEWLEILAESGLEAIGVDTNARMAQEAADNGLRIELQDALEHLGGRPNNSVAIITAFHMVEHVPTDYLIGLLDECQRVLAEDGLLILETPNPENISVSTNTFHLDPTHKSPLPPGLLEFLVRQAGFAETAILRLNGEPMIEAGPIERSIHLMFDVARDYACLARKQDGQSSEEHESLAEFVQVASQQAPNDMVKIKGWLHSADNDIAGDLSAAKAQILLQIDHFHQLIAALTAQMKSAQKESVAFRSTVASLARQIETRDVETALIQKRIARIESTTLRRLVKWVSALFSTSAK